MRRRIVTLLMPCALLSFAHGQAPSTEPSTRPSSSPTTAPASLFDPTRHLHVSEVRAGMKGYGLTVLSGTKIDRFEVEVISTLHNSFGPQQDVVMIRCLGETMQHTGPIAGCSGSPIYLYDDTGKARLIGAYAFGFDTSKDPIVGVQPIEYMLRLAKPPADADDTATKPMATLPRSWSLLKSASWRATLRGAAAEAARREPMPAKSGFRPLAVPLAITGASEATLATLRPMFESHGFAPMLAPGTTSPATNAAGETPKIEPGSVLGAAVLSGDLELTALGTCTEVIDGRAFGFGHPFNGEGATSIPMGPGSVSLVMPLLTNSFKLGGLTSVTGAIDMDGSAGIAGQIGATAKTVPIEIEVDAGDEAPPRTFHYRAALHRTFTPMMIATALQGSIVAGRQLPVEHTATYHVDMKFAGSRTLAIDNIATSLDGFDLGRDAVWPVSVAMENPFGIILVESVKAKVTIDRGVRAALIESASPAQPAYRPGETARLNVRLRQYKGEALTKSIDVKLPDTLKDGDYAISLSDAATKMGEDAVGRPDLFAVRNLDELFATMQTIATSGRNDAIYVRLTGGTQESLAIGRTQLAKLPPSRRATIAAAGRPDVAALPEERLSVVPMGITITGTASATIHVKKKLN